MEEWPHVKLSTLAIVFGVFQQKRCLEPGALQVINS